jgi:hypothetical protein
MCIRKRTVMAWGTAVVLLAFLSSFLAMSNTARRVAAEVDWCAEMHRQFDAFNRGEIDLENYADDMVFQAMPICQGIECVGKDAYRNHLRHYVDRNAHITITSCEVSENVVLITCDWVCDPTRAAGVDRIVSQLTYEIDGDQVVAQRGSNDMTDPQTAQYVRYYLTRPSAAFAMGPGRDADQSPGVADMREFPGFVTAAVRIAAGPPGVAQPVHIHEGTCADLGPAVFSFRDMSGGIAYTVLRNVSLSDLQTGNHAIAVQESEEEPDVFVACGDIPAAAPEEPSVEPVPAPEAITAPAPPPAGSGGLIVENGGMATWCCVLAASGALLLAAGSWYARRHWLT